ncbi:MAG: trypsin-like peptidase domain-containing protein [Deltaproteobacteria bacterium]|jgi:hypothetical protein|nr:trypsin-like peptidase domain-containing protein [Deltaproteobacteria bacterium]
MWQEQTKWHSVLVFTSIVLTIFFSGSRSVAITNGQAISEESTPAITFIEIIQNQKVGICTGVVVGDGVILTAEHCAFVENPSSIRINKTYAVKRIFVDDSYEHESRLDLALLEIEKGAIGFHMPIFNGTFPKTSQAITIVGYGMAYTGDDEFTFDESIVKRVGMNTMNPAEHDRLMFNLESEFGTNDPSLPAGSLPGDSGGPMIYDKFIVGIASKSLFGISSYTNLNSARAKQFLEAAGRAGWKIEYSNK